MKWMRQRYFLNLLLESREVKELGRDFSFGTLEFLVKSWYIASNRSKEQKPAGGIATRGPVLLFLSDGVLWGVVFALQLASACIQNTCLHRRHRLTLCSFLTHEESPVSAKTLVGFDMWTAVYWIRGMGELLFNWSPVVEHAHTSLEGIDYAQLLGLDMASFSNLEDGNRSLEPDCSWLINWSKTADLHL